MNTPQKDITKAVEDLQKNAELEKDFQARAGNLEEFYQEMLAAGIARKEDYNIVATGEALKLDVSFLVRG